MNSDMNLMVITDDELCPPVQAFVWAVFSHTGGKWCVIASTMLDAFAIVRGNAPITGVPVGHMIGRRALPADLDVADLVQLQPHNGDLTTV